jgi:hypothetical protein
MSPDASTKLLNGLIPDGEIQSTPIQTDTTQGSIQQKVNLTEAAIPTIPVGGEVERNLPSGDISRSTEQPPPSQASDEIEKSDAYTAKETAASDEEPKEKKKSPDLQPDSLKLEGKEKKAMMALVKVIGRTPRTLKRFINVYRIIKAGLKDEKLNSFKGTGDSDGEFRTVLVLLGVAHGSPEVAPVFFRKLREKHEQLVESKKEIGFKGFLAELKDDPSKDVLDGWTPLVEELLEFADNYTDDIPLVALRRWAPTVVRYTFQLGRMSEVI